MNRRENSDFEELEELLWRAEEAMKDPPAEPEEDYEDYSEFLYPEEETADPVLYRNFANSYGGESDTEPRRSAPVRQQYDPEPRRPEPVRQQYNPESAYPNSAYDTYGEPEYEDQPVQRSAPRKKEKKRKRRRGCGCGCFTWLLVFLAAIVAAVFLIFQPPRSEDSIGSRKLDTATVLICGTDEDGTRTDTMMLLYLSGTERQASLLSLPRDSYTITSSGNAAKLNSAYGRNGTGAEGMEALLDYVQDIIGYRPDGYILVDFTLVPQIVDIMGGVDVDVPMDMSVSGISLKEGYQHLNGEQVLTLLRYRKGYATADLARVEVQRTVLKACIEQWLSADHLKDALDAVSLLENGSISSLSTNNYLWMARTLLMGMGNFRNDTLPGYADYRGGVSYYILNKSEIADLINEAYNPYKVTIGASDLNIAG